uniref:NADH-ubiquinone oxidoreductase chain 1 n=1 Tax=Pyrocoelia analis TaxID=1453205 RepID=A0A8K1VG81_9COLE|nr:NADH dehydrogenase subunit 1 [Pyrocoelia analis]UEN67853.1 NADH dehydrogenase subunit 1 [Pyrocoelia analis]UZG66119.1 NADH dehydrogenase subunit 1 [Pyrocoelia analis]
MFMLDLIIIFLNLLILVIGVLVGLAFLTLLERKVLGYIQLRKGPNKVGFIGIMQPFSDAVKLFSKEQISPIMSNYMSYYMSPIFSLFISLLIWICLPFFTSFLNFTFSVLFFLCISSLGVYTVMVAGWSSNSNYSMLGGLRCVAQTISYEVSLFMILLSFLILIGSLSIFDMVIYQKNIWFLFISIPLCMIWFSSSLAETNRTPFDFAEGESELVSGFNVEYSGGGFALIFMAEYSSILFMSSFFVYVFMGGLFMSFIFFIMILLISFAFIWTRGTLPRFRYDKLMYLTWKGFLPVSLNFLMFFFGLKFLIDILII